MSIILVFLLTLIVFFLWESGIIPFLIGLFIRILMPIIGSAVIMSLFWLYFSIRK